MNSNDVDISNADETLRKEGTAKAEVGVGTVDHQHGIETSRTTCKN